MTLTKLIELQAASAAVSDFDRFNEFTEACENFDFAALDEKVRMMETALRRIEKWHGEFPITGKFWANDDGSLTDRPMSYGSCYGSNGEREYMREVARAALEGME